MISSSMPRRLCVLCFFLTFLGAYLWNHNFGEWTSISQLRSMNDVPDIWRGFDKTPNWPFDGLKWWHGPWIQEGVGAFRPLSSHFLWMETALGRKYGFVWVGYIGIALLGAVSFVCTLLAWEYTRNWGAVVLAAILAPAARFFLMGGAPEYWLMWYACHHDLLMSLFLLGAILDWTRWLQNSRRCDVVLAYICFVAGVLCKEFVYIFPLMALGIALGHPRRDIPLRVIWLHFGAMMAGLALMWLYRSAVLPIAYNPPPLKLVHFLKRPFLYWFAAFYRYIIPGIWFSPGLALYFFVACGFWLRFGARFTGLGRRYLPTLTILGGAALYCSIFFEVGQAFWYFSEGSAGQQHFRDVVWMIFTIWTLWATFKYRKSHPTLAVLSVFLLAYVPVWTYLGWHYTIFGWFARAGLWWPLIWQLFALEVRGFLPTTRQMVQTPIACAPIVRLQSK